MLVLALAAYFNQTARLLAKEVLFVVPVDDAHGGVYWGRRVDGCLLLDAHHVRQLLHSFVLVHLREHLIEEFVHH
jgi:hypothetical protein